ncbi:hypothetical protein CGLO_17997 [Colletotrichum gloeosporioides Cg-14]|nr:hypothetical protein CGLO_17997 [Colletotrichum gloeosporioides Cg-14]
MKCVCGF